MEDFGNGYVIEPSHVLFDDNISKIDSFSLFQRNYKRRKRGD